MKWPLLLISAIVIFFLYLFVRSCKDVDEIVYTPAEIQEWKNKAGQAVYSLKQKEAEFSRKEKKWLDSIAKVQGTKTKYITSYIRINTHSVDTLHSTDTVLIERQGSEITQLSQRFRTPYYNANAVLNVDGSKSRLSIESFDTLQVLTRTVKEGSIFNRKTFLQLDVINSNPSVKVTGIKAYKVATPVAFNAFNGCVLRCRSTMQHYISNVSHSLMIE